MAEIDELADTQSGTSCLDSVYNDLVELNTEMGGHTHDETGGVVVMMISANYAALGTGTTDGEIRVTADTSKMYIWEDGGSVWVPQGGSVIRNQVFS